MSITNKVSVELGSNGKKIGELVRMPGDGEWAFLPDLNGGLWTSWILRQIADIIDESNEALPKL